jgi:hypothetical protein
LKYNNIRLFIKVDNWAGALNVSSLARLSATWKSRVSESTAGRQAALPKRGSAWDASFRPSEVTAIFMVFSLSKDPFPRRRAFGFASVSVAGCPLAAATDLISAYHRKSTRNQSFHDRSNCGLDGIMVHLYSGLSKTDQRAQPDPTHNQSLDVVCGQKIHGLQAPPLDVPLIGYDGDALDDTVFHIDQGKRIAMTEMP